MKYKIYKIVCFLFGHKRVDNNCKRCHAKFGVPLMRNPPMPPCIKKSDCLSGRLQIPEVKNKLPPPPILFEEVEEVGQ